MSKDTDKREQTKPEILMVEAVEANTGEDKRRWCWDLVCSQRIEERKCSKREEKQGSENAYIYHKDGVEEQVVRRRKRGGELVGALSFFS